MLWTFFPSFGYFFGKVKCSGNNVGLMLFRTSPVIDMRLTAGLEARLAG